MDSAKKSFCTRGAAITQWNRLRAIFCICIEKGTKLVNVRR